MPERFKQCLKIPHYWSISLGSRGDSTKKGESIRIDVAWVFLLDSEWTGGWGGGWCNDLSEWTGCRGSCNLGDEPMTPNPDWGSLLFNWPTLFPISNPKAKKRRSFQFISNNAVIPSFNWFGVKSKEFLGQLSGVWKISGSVWSSCTGVLLFSISWWSIWAGDNFSGASCGGLDYLLRSNEIPIKPRITRRVPFDQGKCHHIWLQLVPWRQL